jgi:hypothetical protein
MLSEMIVQLTTGGCKGPSTGSGESCTGAPEVFSSMMASLDGERSLDSSGDFVDARWGTLFPEDFFYPFDGEADPGVFSADRPAELADEVLAAAFMDASVQPGNPENSSGAGWNTIPGNLTEKEKGELSNLVSPASPGIGSGGRSNGAPGLLQAMGVFNDGNASGGVVDEDEIQPVSTKHPDFSEKRAEAGTARVAQPGSGNLSEFPPKPQGGEPNVKPQQVDASGANGFDSDGGDTEEGRAGGGGRESELTKEPRPGEVRAAGRPEPATPEAPASGGKAERSDHNLHGGQDSREGQASGRSAAGAEVGKAAGQSSAADTPREADAETRQTARLVSGAVMKARGASRTMEIQMKPEVLGRLRIELAINGKQTDIKMITEGLAAKEAIEQGMAQIRADLQRQGLELQRCEVQLGGGSGSGGEAGGKADGRPSKGRLTGSGRRNDENDVVAGAGEVVADTEKTGMSKVDFFA